MISRCIYELKCPAHKCCETFQDVSKSHTFQLKLIFCVYKKLSLWLVATLQAGGKTTAAVVQANR